jgi:hypothetical protein
VVSVISVVSCEDIDVSESCPEVLDVLDVLVSDVSAALEVESSVDVADIEVSVNAEVTV